MRSLTRLLDDPVHDRLEQAASRLSSGAKALLKRLERARAGAHLSPTGAAQTSEPAAGEVSGAEFRSCDTGLERDRIEATGVALRLVGEHMQQCGQRLELLPQGTLPLDLTELASVLVDATALVAALVTQLRSMTGMDAARNLLQQIQDLEERGALRTAILMRELYTAPLAPGRLLALKDLIDLLDAAMEECGNAAQLVWEIILENN